MESNPKARSAVDCEETDQWGVKEEISRGIPVEENQATMEPRRYRRVTCRGGAIAVVSPHMPAVTAERQPLQRGWPSKCPMHQATERTSQTGSLTACCQRLEKDYDRAIAPAVQAV